MNAQPDKTEAMLQTLRDRYRAGLGTTIAALELLAAQIETAEHGTPALESLRREMHRLHGSAGTYGFPHASHLAGALEARVLTWIADPDADAAERSVIVGHFIKAFRGSILGDEGAARAAEPPMVLMAGLPAKYAQAVQSEAALRGIGVRSVEKGGITRETIEAIAPRVLVVPAALVKRVPPEVAIPVIAVASKRATASPTRGAKPDVSAIVIDAGEPPARLLTLVQELAARADFGGATLLVVDDDPAILVIVRALAEHDGMRVVTLDSPAGLQDAIDREQPAMLLMDVQMGEEDGIATTRALRARAGNRDLPILLFSGSMGIATREAAFRAGADDFFAKPIVPQELRQRLHQRLERRRLRRVAEGLHPVLDVTLDARTMREGAAALAARTAKCLVVIHPAPGFDDTAWVGEVRRVAGAMRAHAMTLGFHDGDALLAVTSDEAPALVKRLAATRAETPAGAPAWHAGVATRDDAGGSFERARHAALEALDVARRSAGSGVHRWTLADEAVAPDGIIVEDDMAVSEMLQYALRSGGYTYQAFADGKAAHQALVEMRTGNRRPILLLDVDLPGMDGHSLHERLRVERPGAFVVVFLSVHAAEGDQVRALHAGAWDYLTKPLNLRVLMAKLPIWLTRAAAEP